MVGGDNDTLVGRLKNTSGVFNLEGDGTRSIRFGSSTNGEVVRIDNTNERVGVGTTSPGAKLEIFGTGNTLRLDSAANQSKTILLRNVGSGTAEIKTDGDLKLNAEDSGKNIQLFTENTEKMRVHSNGRVSIGSTTASANTLTLSGTGTEVDIENTSSNGKRYRIASTSSGVLEFLDKTANIERLRIHSDGSIGIGATPTNKLHVNAGTTNIVAQFQSTDGTGGIMLKDSSGNVELTTSGTHGFNIQPNGGSTVFRVNQDGKVGINTTSPEAKLTVFGGVAGGTHTHAVFTGTAGRGIALKSGQTGGQHNGKAIIDAQDTEAGGASMDLQIGGSTKLAIANSGSIGIGVVPFAHSLGTSVNVDLLGNGGIWGYAGATYVNSNAYYNSGWKYKSNGVAAALQVGGSSQILTFRQAASGTAGSAVTYTERFRVHTNGNVGIGTSSPTGKLNVEAPGNHLHLRAGTAAAGKYWNFDVTANNQLFIITDGNNGMNITNTGNVGIGASSPQTSLQVNGTVSSFNAHFGPGQNNGAGNFGGISLGYAENANALYRKVGIVAQTKGDNSARQDLHFLVDTVNDQNSAGIADSKMHIKYNTGDVVINNNLGINTTTPYGKLDVYGALTVGPANLDSAVTLSEVGNDVSLTNGGGSIEINMPIQGTTTNNCTLVFTYAKASWASWILDYEFASVDGMSKGVVGGYNNGSLGHSKTQMLAGITHSVSVGYGGAGNQHVIVTFTFSGSMGIHPFARFKYSQGGGDGTPRADRVSVTYTEGS